MGTLYSKYQTHYTTGISIARNLKLSKRFLLLVKKKLVRTEILHSFYHPVRWNAIEQIMYRVCHLILFVSGAYSGHTPSSADIQFAILFNLLLLCFLFLYTFFFKLFYLMIVDPQNTVHK